ncbi:hypothetical protein GALMADRAFT_138885 [Galerina marginata CBS 339.88]|uniref:Uncharacterized protein n=1 Tax=Galerina marginata (strain CBS 339.88) TaxID=685588 RepID=A0A067TD66_GALM3|nr:hypothetical protein GALMADRAFT_138885 [Galerina marginata CBS 339.88]
MSNNKPPHEFYRAAALEQDGFCFLNPFIEPTDPQESIRLSTFSQLVGIPDSRPTPSKFFSQVTELHRAVLDSTYCPLLHDHVENLYIITPCGHEFSSHMLHRLFQAVIDEELKLEKHSVLAIPPIDPNGPVYSSEQLKTIKDNSTVPFLPKYRCPICRVRIRQPPTLSQSYIRLIRQVESVLEQYHLDIPEKDLETVNGAPANWRHYFIFFKQ